jgi:hypothetical protein
MVLIDEPASGAVAFPGQSYSKVIRVCSDALVPLI